VGSGDWDGNRWGFADFDGPGAPKAVETAVRRSASGKLALHLGRRVFISPCLSAPPAALRIKHGSKSTDAAAVTQAPRRGKSAPAEERRTVPSDKNLRPAPSDKYFGSASCSADIPRAKPGRSERRRHAAAAVGSDRPAKDTGKRKAELSG
jgi:hypothetical protein